MSEPVPISEKAKLLVDFGRRVRQLRYGLGLKTALLPSVALIVATWVRSSAASEISLF